MKKPTILSQIVVPTGGYNFRVYLSKAARYDTTVDATLPAGNYYLSGDCQSDDFLWKLSTVINTAAIAAGMTSCFTAIWFTTNLDGTSDTVPKIRISFEYTGNPNRDVQIDWGLSTEIGAILGFYTGANDVSTGVDYPEFTADYRPGYFWQAEEDGQLESFNVEDESIVSVSQSVDDIDGGIRTQYHGERFSNSLRLAWLERVSTFSNDIGYGVAPVHPYSRNRGLECWWDRAKQGYPFRVYPDRWFETTKAIDVATVTTGSPTAPACSAKAWETEPQRFKSRMVVDLSYVRSRPMGWFISSHTATALTVANAHPANYNIAGTIYLFDFAYQTYVIDLSEMSRFVPEEIPQLDRYNITIPLLRYVA